MGKEKPYNYRHECDVVDYASSFTAYYYFLIKYDLGQKYYTPQVQPDWGSNS